MLETLVNGAIIFDRFDYEIDRRPAEVIFCFLPGNAMTPFTIWHRTKADGQLFSGRFYPGNEHDNASAYFKELRTKAPRASNYASTQTREVPMGGAHSPIVTPKDQATPQRELPQPTSAKASAP